MKHTELLLDLVPRGTLHPPLLVFRSGECNNADRGAWVSGRTQQGSDPGAACPQPYRPVELGCWLEKGRHPPGGFRQGLSKYGSAGGLSAVRAPVSRGRGLIGFRVGSPLDRAPGSRAALENRSQEPLCPPCALQRGRLEGCVLTEATCNFTG